MKKFLLLPFLLLALFACDEDIMMEEEQNSSIYSTCLTFGPGDEDEIVEAFLSIEDSTKIILEAGNYDFDRLQITGANTVLIQGAGKDQTVLDFSAQTSGGEGVSISNTDNVTLRDFKAMDSKGDLIKLNQCTNVVLNNVSAIWTADTSSASGGYALYPVLCTNVLIDSCNAEGASDAGIYVGQSDNAVIRNSTASRNVAGCEVENTTNAEVYDNEFFNNTAGFLAFDLPGLSKRGGNVDVHDNYIHDNNLKNFAPTSGTVASVPPGTGILHLAMSDAEYYNNRIENNNLASFEVVSGFALDPNAADNIGANYSPFPVNISIHDNTMSKSATIPQTTIDHSLGSQLYAIHLGLLLLENGTYTEMQHIIIDGINTNVLAGHDSIPNPDNLCIDEDEAQLFLDADLARAASGPPTWQYSLDVSPFECP